jgi:hypothetical protein
MQIEELSKSQLILLTILVNFVTSIATGILTVSLLDHAPPVVTQTVNRVVEHTIETVAQAAPAAVAQAPAPAPSNQDLVVNALAAQSSRLVGIHAAGSGTSTPALAVGTFLPKASVVVTAAADSLPQEALIEFPDGAFIAASLARAGNGIAVYGFAGDAAFPKATSAALVAGADLKLGETALALSADGSAGTGIVSRVSKSGIHTTLPDIGTGNAAVDLAGNIIGIAAGGTAGLLIPAEVVTALLAATSSPATSTPAAAS